MSNISYLTYFISATLIVIALNVAAYFYLPSLFLTYAIFSAIGIASSAYAYYKFSRMVNAIEDAVEE